MRYDPRNAWDLLLCFPVTCNCMLLNDYSARLNPSWFSTFMSTVEAFGDRDQGTILTAQ